MSHLERVTRQPRSVYSSIDQLAAATRLPVLTIDPWPSGIPAPSGIALYNDQHREGYLITAGDDTTQVGVAISGGLGPARTDVVPTEGLSIAVEELAPQRIRVSVVVKGFPVQIDLLNLSGEQIQSEILPRLRVWE